jgi:hypothetical protein
MAVFIIVAGNPVFDVGLFRQGNGARLAGHSRILIHIEDVGMPFFPNNLLTLRKGHKKRYLLLFHEIGNSEGGGTVDRTHENVNIFLHYQLFGHGQADVGLKLLVAGSIFNLFTKDAALGIDVVNNQLEAVQNILGESRWRPCVGVSAACESGQTANNPTNSNNDIEITNDFFIATSPFNFLSLSFRPCRENSKI